MKAISAQMATFIDCVTQLVKTSDIQRRDWRRQTDAVKLACSVAQMISEDPQRVVMVDGRIETSLIGDALRKGGVKAFFAQRCHDKKLTCPRIIILDTKSGNAMDEKGNRASNLHFHAFFLLEVGQDDAWLLDRLRAVFGRASTIGPRQFMLKRSDPTKHHSFGERQATGIGGKLFYMLSHAGTTHANLKVNGGGKRSRSAPLTRQRCNKESKGLAAGRPSNFLAKITIFDNKAKAAAQKSFENWMAIDKAASKSATLDEVTCHDYEAGYGRTDDMQGAAAIGWLKGVSDAVGNDAAAL